MDPKNPTCQNTFSTQPAPNHLHSLGKLSQLAEKLNATNPQGIYNQWQVDNTQLPVHHLRYEGASPTTSTPVIQRQMALKTQTENHLPRNKPSSLHAFSESSANEHPVTWLNKEQGTLQVNDWSLTEAQWKQDQRQKGLLNPSDSHNAICDSEDIDGLSDQQYKLSLYKTELVTKMATDRASRHQHAPYNIPERLKGPEQRLSTDSVSAEVNITKPAQHEIASSPQQNCCTFLARQADIGLFVTWIDIAKGALKVINPEQLNNEWLILQQQYNLVNGETLQNAFNKESEKNDIQCLGVTSANEIIFQLNYQHYPADTTSSVKDNQTTALSTSKRATPYTNPPQDSISTLVNTAGSMPLEAQFRLSVDPLLEAINVWGQPEFPLSPLPQTITGYMEKHQHLSGTEPPGDVLDFLEAQPGSPIDRTDHRQIPLSVQSTKPAQPINSAYKAPKSCQGCLSFIFSNADAQQSFAAWHNRAKGELIIDMEKLTSEWLSINPSGYSEQIGFDFVSRFFAVQNYWTFDETRNIFSLNLRHPTVQRALRVTTLERPLHSSLIQAPDLSGLANRNKRLSASELQASNPPLTPANTNILVTQKNPMLEWIKQDVGGRRKFTQWHAISRNELKLNLATLQRYWATNLKFFSLENIPSNAARESISKLVEEGLCQYDHKTRILTLQQIAQPL